MKIYKENIIPIILNIIGAPLFIWMFLSLMEVWLFNLGNHVYSNYNFFMVLLKLGGLA